MLLLARVTAFCLEEPDPISRARISASERFSRPRARSFSLGLVDKGKSLIRLGLAIVYLCGKISLS